MQGIIVQLDLQLRLDVLRVLTVLQSRQSVQHAKLDTIVPHYQLYL